MRALALLLLVACSSAKKPAPDAGAALPIYVDQRLVTSVAAAQLRARVRLDALVPAGGWRELVGEQAGGRAVYVRRPAELHVGQTAWLYLAADGTPALGMFVDRPPPSLAGQTLEPTAGGAGLVSLHVRTREPEAEPEVARHPIRMPRGEPLTPEDLAGVPLALPPRRSAGGQGGWDLAALLRERVADPLPALQLVGADGTVLELSAADLARADRLLHLRWNRRGQARLRWFATDGTGALAELQDLVEVKLSAR